MTVGDLKKQFERLGADDNTELYLVDVVKPGYDIAYDPICVCGFQQKGVAIWFYGSYGKEVDYTMMKPDIVYLCAGKGMPCYLHPYCVFRGDPVAEDDPICSHTLKPECAKHGACEDPENHPERFIFYDRREDCGPSYYWEEEPK